MTERNDAEQRTEPTHPEPETVRDAERPAVKGTTEARQGRPTRRAEVRTVMFVSIALVVAAFAIIYAYFAMA